MAKYRKKPVVIEAIKWTGDNLKEMVRFTDKIVETQEDFTEGITILVIKTLEGNMKAFPGDMIIKGVKGEFYPCKPDIFEATYEKVEE